MFDTLYKSRPMDTLPGLKGTYKAPERFEHGVMTLVALVKAQNGDGQAVAVFETRMPARFFRLVAQPKAGEDGTSSVFVLETGTMQPRLVAEIANAIAEGMLTLVEREPSAQSPLQKPEVEALDNAERCSPVNAGVRGYWLSTGGKELSITQMDVARRAIIGRRLTSRDLV